MGLLRLSKQISLMSKDAILTMRRRSKQLLVGMLRVRRVRPVAIKNSVVTMSR